MGRGKKHGKKKGGKGAKAKGAETGVKGAETEAAAETDDWVQQMFNDEKRRLVGENPDGALLKELIGKGLYITKFDFDDEKLVAAVTEVVNNDKIFTSQHKAKKGKGEWYGTGGRAFTIRVREILGGHHEFVRLLEWIERTFNAEIVDIFVAWYVEEAKHKRPTSLAGFFAAHRDNFKHVDFRLPITLGDSLTEKLMTFYKEKGTKNERRVTIRVPHGTVIAMSRVVAGADHDEGEGCGLYWHEVSGAGGTYLIGVQIKVNVEEEEHEE